MKKLTFVIVSLFFIVSGMSVQAQGFRHNRMGSYIGIGFATLFFIRDIILPVISLFLGLFLSLSINLFINLFISPFLLPV